MFGVRPCLAWSVFVVGWVEVEVRRELNLHVVISRVLCEMLGVVTYLFFCGVPALL